MGLILLIILIIILIGVIPSWPHAQNWGYGPVGILVFLLVLFLILMLLGAIPWGFGNWHSSW